MIIISSLSKIFVMKVIKRSVAPVVMTLVVAASVTWLYVARKTITVVIDGEQNKIVTFQSTVAEAFNKEKIDLGAKDKIDTPLESKVTKNEIIRIKRAVPVTVAVDGKELSIKSAEDNIDAMLKVEKITLKPEDKITPIKETKLTSGMKVAITRVETKTVLTSFPIDYKTIVKHDGEMLKTQSKILQEGQVGEKQITTSVVYENGKEVSKKIVKEAVVKQPMNKIIAQGTLNILPLSRGGKPTPYTKAITVKATAYYAVRGVGRTYTASGRKAVREPGGYSTVAVDPRVIPLGTRLYIDGYGFAIAADTGTAVKGHFIDVFFNTYKEACRWAVKYPKVYILK